MRPAPRERALAFVGAHGDEAAVLRAEALAGRGAVDRALAALGAPSSVPEALALLGAADDLGGLRSPLAERGVAWAEAAQAEDGSWGDLFATGMLGGYLGKTLSVRPRTLEAAGAWLGRAWAPERVKGGDWEAIAAFAHFFANVPHELSDAALQWCGRELERGYRSGAFDALGAARVLCWCDADAMPGARLGVAELRDAVLALQQPDGGWPAAGGSPGARVARTLDALVALGRWDRRQARG